MARMALQEKMRHLSAIVIEDEAFAAGGDMRGGDRGSAKERLARRLAVLGCPTRVIAESRGKGEAFDPLHPKKTRQLVSLVAWLEDRKIRLYAQHAPQRAALRGRSGGGANRGWWTAFSDYLADLDCPCSPDPVRVGARHRSVNPASILWLVGVAIKYEREDVQDALEATVAATDGAVAGGLGALRHLAPVGEGSAAGVVRTPEAVSAAAASAAAALPPALAPASPRGRHEGGNDNAHNAAMCSRVASAATGVYAALGMGPGRTAETARELTGLADLAELVACWAAAVGTIAESRKPPSAPDSAKNQHGAFTNPFRPGQAMPRDLSMFPLGFSSGDATVDRCATVLRMLYLRDLRILQDGINNVLETAQQYTANPKTDARLGKVGRG